MAAYTGALTRKAHYAIPNDVAPGVSKDHVNVNPNPDIFDNAVTPPSAQSGDVWNPAEALTVSQVVGSPAPVAHWFNCEPAVPSSVPYGTAQQTMQDRLMVNHSFINYQADSVRLYQHESEGVSIGWEPGRMPQHSGESVGDNESYLMMGRNSYDVTNQPNEVYAGDAANVGRYRVGQRISMFGLYENPHGKFGQDASLRAYTGLAPQFPVDKPAIADPAPYTPNSTGTTTWKLPAFQLPSLFGLPSETAVTDFTLAAEQNTVSGGFSSEGDRL